jgi:hypothetical protein
MHGGGVGHQRERCASKTAQSCMLGEELCTGGTTEEDLHPHDIEPHVYTALS